VVKKSGNGGSNLLVFPVQGDVKGRITEACTLSTYRETKGGKGAESSLSVDILKEDTKTWEKRNARGSLTKGDRKGFCEGGQEQR